jgi:hypothetical protein
MTMPGKRLMEAEHSPSQDRMAASRGWGTQATGISLTSNPTIGYKMVP